jgi:hypothetical protein
MIKHQKETETIITRDEMVYHHACNGCTEHEIKTAFNIENFSDIEQAQYNRGNAEFILNLRAAQANLAFGGDSQMAKWLGQMNLKQQETNRTEVVNVYDDRVVMERTLKNLIKHEQSVQDKLGNDTTKVG